MFSLFPRGQYYRVINYDDTIPNSLPQQLNMLVTKIEYRHAGDEVWFWDKAEPLNHYKVCENAKDEPENVDCSLSHR